jgi:hypothetical protein
MVDPAEQEQLLSRVNCTFLFEERQTNESYGRCSLETALLEARCCTLILTAASSLSMAVNCYLVSIIQIIFIIIMQHHHHQSSAHSSFIPHHKNIAVNGLYLPVLSHRCTVHWSPRHCHTKRATKSCRIAISYLYYILSLPISTLLNRNLLL